MSNGEGEWKKILSYKKVNKEENLIEKCGVYIVWVFTFTLEKMFAESEENGKDLPETISS